MVSRFLRHALVVGVVLALLAQCSPPLQDVPDEITSGIAVYEDPHYQGESGLITENIPNLASYDGPCVHPNPDPEGADIEDWEDCISAVRVAPGWTATLYSNRDYIGDSLVTTTAVTYLKRVPGRCPGGGLNDCVSSVRVRLMAAAP